MKVPLGLRIYRSALRCYPRAFRDEYGADMVALLEDQLRDEHPMRVWARVVADFSLSVPAQHLEVHMKRPPNLVLPALFTGISTAGVLIILVGGAGGVTLTAGAILSLASAILAMLAWRDSREVTAGGAPDHWWKFLLAGVSAMVAFVVLTSVIGEISERTWAIAMVALVVAIVLIATGLILLVGRISRGQLRGDALP